MSDVIFIVGYYRSGTSGLSGALQRLGVEIQSEAAANEHNPLGFYEIPELINFDVELMNSLGMQWADVAPLAEGWHLRPEVAGFTARLDQILRRRFPAATKLWGIKHPHLCHLLPLYEQAVRQAGHRPHVVHIFRDPATSAASQQLKNGLSRAHALLLWLGYATAAERNARHLQRSWLTYGGLLADPSAAFRQLEADLALPLTRLRAGGMEEARAYLTGELNRSRALPSDGLYQPLERLVARLWGAIEAGDHDPALWDEVRAEAAGIASFLSEIRDSRLRALPGLGGPAAPAATAPQEARAALRPPERLDDAARTRLDHLCAGQGALPRVAVVIAAPGGRAAAIGETLAVLKGQWRAADLIRIVSVDPATVEGIETITAPAEPGGVTATLCEELNRLAQEYDYVAALNAGDKLDPDAIQRFALAAAGAPDMVYCDEIVPNGDGPWVRYKPGWDITRLRQSAYLGDWVWYRGETITRLNGFDPAFAGAEEYEFQLRLGEHEPNVLRLPEALFVREAGSRRDDIAADDFVQRAEAALAAHLARLEMPARIARRQFIGLFKQERTPEDPGTSVILLCDGADVATVNQRLTALLEPPIIRLPVIIAAQNPQPDVADYLTQIEAQRATLGQSVRAVPPAAYRGAGAFAQALALVETPHLAILDARAEPTAPDWLATLRNRLADPGVAMVGARTLVPGAGGTAQPMVQGPIVIGAPVRLGHGYAPDAGRMGGWLLVDQEASAIAPPGLLARTAALCACALADLPGDAFWIDLCAQLRAAGHRLVWTPDVSFQARGPLFQPDPEGRFRTGSRAARDLPWQDPHHHPALSLREDLLVPESRTGLVAAAPEDPASVLFTGQGAGAEPVLAAARAFRTAGGLEAGWGPEPLAPAELGRRAPSAWVRVNPDGAPGTTGQPYTALFCAPPREGAAAAMQEAAAVYATSPALVSQLRALGGAAPAVQLWRPALHRANWETLQLGTGLNTRTRVLWFDEGETPPWFTDLVNETIDDVSWIIAGQKGVTYNGQVTCLPRHLDEALWARDLAMLAPQILLRPAGRAAWGDCYFTLLAAAAGAHLILDKRLDTPESLPGERLGPAPSLWKSRLLCAARDLKTTLSAGKATREAALALPSVETQDAPWLQPQALLEAAQ